MGRKGPVGADMGPAYGTDRQTLLGVWPDRLLYEPRSVRTCAQSIRLCARDQSIKRLVHLDMVGCVFHTDRMYGTGVAPVVAVGMGSRGRLLE